MNKISMPQELKDKWVAALRSGKYKQAKGALYNPIDKGYCCLGVLMAECNNGLISDFDGSKSYTPKELQEFAAENGIIDTTYDDDFEDTEVPTVPSLEWASNLGIAYPLTYITKTFNPEFLVDGITLTASQLNDEYEYTFEQIADLIEEQVEVVK